MNTRTFLPFLCTIGGLVALSGCSSSTELPTTEEATQSPIAFSSYVGASTRGAVTYLNDLQENGFMVFANKTADEWAKDGNTSTANFMYEQEVRFSALEADDVATWHYAPIKFWPRKEKVSFFAYSPYANPVRSNYTDMSHSAWDTPGATQLTYTLPSVAIEQDDIIAAAALDYDIDRHGGKVDFTFQHVLSKIGFAAHSKSELGAGSTLEITKLDIRYKDGAIRNKAVLDLADVAGTLPADLWKDTASPSHFNAGDGNLEAGSLLGDAIGARSSVTISNTATSITSKDAYLMLIPQAYNAGDLIVTLSYKLTTKDPKLVQNVVQTVENKEIELPTIATGWLPGKQYTYILTVGPEAVQFDSHIDVNDWDTASQHPVIVEDATTVPTTDIYYKDKAFYIGSAVGMGIFRDITNGDNKQVISGYVENQGIPNNYRECNLVLEQDIDMSIFDNWVPIKYWRGGFDGQDHTISNLHVEGNGDYLGLFAYIPAPTLDPATYYIKDLHLKDFIVQSIGGDAGALAATTSNMVIQNCSHEVSNLTSSISISGNSDVGGLCGDLSSSVMINCWSKCNVSGRWAGPVVGFKSETDMVGCYGISTRVVSTTIGGSFIGSYGPVFGCAGLYSSLEGSSTPLGAIDNTGCFAATDYATLSTRIAEMNQACDDWAAAHADYTLTKHFGEGGSGLHFVDR